MSCIATENVSISDCGPRKRKIFSTPAVLSCLKVMHVFFRWHRCPSSVGGSQTEGKPRFLFTFKSVFVDAILK